jgi:hypothetical protein
MTLHSLIRERALAIPDDEALIDELANMRLRESSPGVYRLDHDPDKHDDRAVCLALAGHWLMNLRVLEPRIVTAEELFPEFADDDFGACQVFCVSGRPVVHR